VWKELTKKSVTPSDEEIRINYRARSARLRAAMRIDTNPLALSLSKKKKFPAMGQKERIREIKRLTEIQKKAKE
jgi:hypothetical protein